VDSFSTGSGLSSDSVPVVDSFSTGCGLKSPQRDTQIYEDNIRTINTRTKDINNRTDNMAAPAAQGPSHVDSNSEGAFLKRWQCPIVIYLSRVNLIPSHR